MLIASRTNPVAALLLGLALVPKSALGLPLLSEVFYDAVGSDDGKSFVEIYGVPGTSLDGYSLEGVNGTNGAITPSVALSGAIPDDGLFVLADALGDGTSLVAAADLVLNFDFQNGPDSIVLRNGASVVDALGYGSFAPDEVFAGEGEPAPDAAADSSLARRFADVDSDDNASDWVVQSVPTPGSAPLGAVPEPSTVALLGAGLAGLGRLSRRRSAPR